VVSKYEKFEPTEGFSQLREMLIKISFLHENDDNSDMSTFNFTILNRPRPNKEFESVSINSFRNETNIQVDIHKKSYDYGMPLCPSIIFSQICTSISVPNITDFVDFFRETSSLEDNGQISQTTVNIKQRLFELMETEQITKIGMIAMEFANNYSTLNDLTDRRNDTLNDDQKENCVDMALYLLIQLYKLGYTHGDHHGGNILINTNYDGYFYNIRGRPLIIDFGRTQLLTDQLLQNIPTTLNNLNLLYRGQNYIEILKILNKIRTHDGINLDNRQYNYLFGFANGRYNLITGETTVDFPDPNHTNGMINLLLKAHKQRLKQLETEGDTIDRENYPRMPIYPIVPSDPKYRGLRIYDIHIGGIIKRVKKSKNRKQGKKGKKGKRSKTNKNIKKRK
jgi:hypothetical protein